jgi:hypothetical protein
MHPGTPAGGNERRYPRCSPVSADEPAPPGLVASFCTLSGADSSSRPAIPWNPTGMFEDCQGVHPSSVVFQQVPKLVICNLSKVAG